MFITLYVGFLLCGKDGRSVHRAGLGGGCIPRRWRPQPQRTRADCTKQAAAQAVPDARQTMQGKAHTPGRWTRCTGLHSIPDRPRRADRDGGGVLEGGQRVR